MTVMFVLRGVHEFTTKPAGCQAWAACLLWRAELGTPPGSTVKDSQESKLRCRDFKTFRDFNGFHVSWMLHNWLLACCWVWPWFRLERCKSSRMLASKHRWCQQVPASQSRRSLSRLFPWFSRPQPTFITKTRTHFRMSRSTFLWSQSENHLVSSSALNTFYTCFGATKPIGWCLSIGKPHGFNQLLQLLYPGLEQIADGTHGPLRVPSPRVHLKLRHLAPAEISISREAGQIKPFSTCQLFRSTTIIETNRNDNRERKLVCT